MADFTKDGLNYYPDILPGEYSTKCIVCTKEFTFIVQEKKNGKKQQEFSFTAMWHCNPQRWA
jgi:hypothetical protein